MIAQPLFKRPAGAVASTGYQRPGDWLSITDMSATEGFSGLHAVYDHESNFCAFSCNGAYTVDWGDGSSPENFASGTTAYHNFAWADCDASTLTSRGYRQAVVTVTPQSGQTLTQFNFTKTHNQSGLNTNYTSGWLDLEINGPNLIGPYGVYLNGGPAEANLEKFVVHDFGNATNISNLLFACYSLQSVQFGDTSGITNMYGLFSLCFSLKSIPFFDTSSVTNMALMFQSCYSLQSIPLFDTSSVTSMVQSFQNCYSLQSVPAIDTSSVTSFSNAFPACRSLAQVKSTGISKTISFQGSRLSSAALDEIYTNLATVTGQTITVTGNYGTSGDDPTIATAKGWTVTG